MPAPARSVCLYCGSRPGRDPAYAEAAEALGTALGRGGWGVVYGAGDLGLMGLAAAAAQQAGAQVTGFIPRHLFDLDQYALGNAHVEVPGAGRLVAAVADHVNDRHGRDQAVEQFQG